MRKEPSPAKRCEKMRKDAKRAEKMRKEPFYGRKNMLCYTEIHLDCIDVIENKCQ